MTKQERISIDFSDFISLILQNSPTKPTSTFADGTIIYHQNRTINNYESLINCLCAEIGALQALFQEKTQQENALKEELKECRASLIDSTKRSLYLGNQIKALERSRSGSTVSAPQEKRESVEGNQTLLNEIRRLRGLLSETNAKLEKSEKVAKRRSIKILQLQDTTRELVTEQENELERVYAENKELRETVETQSQVMNDQIVLINKLEASMKEHKLCIPTPHHDDDTVTSTDVSESGASGRLSSSNSSMGENSSVRTIPSSNTSTSQDFVQRKLRALEEALRQNECSTFTMRKLKQKNDYLQQKLEKAEKNMNDANETITALHQIIKGQNELKSWEKSNSVGRSRIGIGSWHPLSSLRSQIDKGDGGQGRETHRDPFCTQAFIMKKCSVDTSETTSSSSFASSVPEEKEP